MVRFGGMSYRTEGLCKARRNVVFSESFPLAVGLSYKYCKRFILNKGANAVDVKITLTFADKVQCSESALKGSIFINAEA